MKKRSRFTNKQNRPIAGRLLNPRSEEHLSLKNQPYLSQKGQSSSETSLHLYTQLNQVVDVLKYEFHSHTEGHTPKRLIQKNSSGQKKKKIEMAEQVAGIIEKRAMLEKEKAAKLNKMTELVKMKGEIEAQLSDPLDEEEEQLREKLLTINKEIQNVDSSIREADAGLKYWEEQLEAAETQFTTEPPTAKKDQSSKDTAEAGGNPTSMVKIKSNMKAEKEKLGGRIKGIDTQENNDKVVKMKSTIQDIQKLMETGYISKADLNIAKLEQKIQNSGSSSVADAKKDEEGLQTNYSGGSKKGVRAAPVSMDQREDGEGKKRPPGPPPPTPDPKAEESEFPLYDSAVLVELREADERAAKAAKAIESVREQLAVYAKKDEMTDEDINMMEEKQKELMAKMEEFEEITKKVQHLVGLVDVASSQLGPPQRPMLPMIEGVRTAAPTESFVTT